MMKRIQFLLLVVALMAMTVCYAQDGSNNDFEKNLNELLFSGALGNSFDKSRMEDSFTKIAANVVGADNAKAKMQEYMNGPMTIDLASLVLPYYKETMSDKDVKYLLEQCNTPEGKLAAEHCAIINSIEGQAQMQSLMMPAIMNALQGLPYEKIEAVNCPESYKSKCYEYVKVTGGSDDMIESIFSAFNELEKQIAMKGEEVEVFNVMMNNLKTLMIENLPVIYLNISYGKITEDDFDFYIDLYSSSAGQNYVKGNKAMLKNVMNISMQLLQRYSNWLQANKPIV